MGIRWISITVWVSVWEREREREKSGELVWAQTKSMYTWTVIRCGDSSLTPPTVAVVPLQLQAVRGVGSDQTPPNHPLCKTEWVGGWTARRVSPWSPPWSVGRWFPASAGGSFWAWDRWCSSLSLWAPPSVLHTPKHQYGFMENIGLYL